MRTAIRNGKWVAVVVAAGLALAGCGGDDGGNGGNGGSDTTEKQAVTKADYIETADRMCQDALDAAGPELDQAADVEAVVAVLVPVYRALVDDLRALDPPEGDEETLAAVYDEVERVLDQLEESPDVLFGTVDPFADANEMAQEYGFEVCGGGAESTDDTGDTTTDSGSASPRDDYIAAADSICVSYSDEINALPEPATDAEFEESALQAVDLTRQELDELRALDVPEGDEEELTAIYDAVDEALDQIEADPMVLRGTVNPLAEAQQLAADYGFQVCGQG